MSATVTMIARTHLEPAALDFLPRSSPDVADADHLAELSGRRCFRSEHRPRAATAANADYLANIIRQAHLSVLSHASAAFMVEGVSIALSHELVRSVFLGYSQESSRYVQPALDVAPVLPLDADDWDAAKLAHDFAQAVTDYREVYRRKIEQGFTAKRAAGVARAWLPRCSPTSLVVSGNMRAWRDFIAQRTSPGAEPEIAAFAHTLLEQLSGIAPATFADLAPVEAAA